MLKWSSMALAVTVLGLGCPAVAAEPEAAAMACPGSVAVIAGNGLSRSVHETVEVLYRRLGCDTHFIAHPGQRGIVAFNQRLVDGELMRMVAAEPEYQRAFSRSEYPVVELNRALWLHPDTQRYADLPIGYQLGGGMAKARSG
ncbi:MAG: hypothetical protein V7752_01400 [Halopseudomonas sp.]